MYSAPFCARVVPDVYCSRQIAECSGNGQACASSTPVSQSSQRTTGTPCTRAGNSPSPITTTRSTACSEPSSANRSSRSARTISSLHVGMLELPVAADRRAARR